ncbi:hypothetical protein [Sphingobium nicotianae]|nr:hypothetical protein [Sphingobium nicotianae]
MGETAYAARKDASQKPALIAMRRAFAKQVIAVAEAAGNDPGLRANPTLEAEFRQRLAQMRSGIALHQAKWPAVLLDDGNDEFRTSADAIIKTNREFAAWALSILP